MTREGDVGPMDEVLEWLGKALHDDWVDSIINAPPDPDEAYSRNKLRRDWNWLRRHGQPLPPLRPTTNIQAEMKKALAKGGQIDRAGN